MVAIEFAASCSPLSKSKASATTMRAVKTGRLRTASIVKTRSELIDDERVDLVGDIFEPVDHRLKMIVKLSTDEVVHHIALRVLAGEQ